MSKLYATFFRYSMLDHLGYRREHAGSYLGRKPASAATLRRFLRRHSRQWKPRLIQITSSGRTNYVAR